ncbi:tetratricopeptide repeat protein [Arenibaculum pallidiluteum]|uniref:tetratricopeptide repeat protein n=1 Tax=Arenibaculum pallidiluteum TaxID=2812559 RepID=UPI001A95B182|nr:tetratricopeptide repeat protein [Arenibaculum pallidiluteum]
MPHINHARAARQRAPILARQRAFLPTVSVLSALVLGLMPLAARAQSTVPVPGQDLAGCLQRVERSPEGGFEWALAWQDRGGGDAARLCQAMALYHAGNYAGAAARLESLARTPGLAAQAPELWARAGAAWLRGNRPAEAERTYAEAIRLRPDDAELRIDRAVARATAERYWEAVEDLDRAIALKPDAVEALVLRGQAHRALNNLPKAQADAAQALRIAPNDPEALLLRGNLRALAGEVGPAREDWQRVARLDPDSAAGVAARDNLARVQPGGAPGAASPAGRAGTPGSGNR